MSETVIPKRTYILVWAALLVLLAATVGVAYSHRLVWVVASAGLSWLAILFALSIGDYFTRGYLPTPSLWQP